MSSLVIKLWALIFLEVKYGDTLRRFNVGICGDRRLDLSMEGLRLKVSSLFNLPADFRLTYEDEDDDMVTLVDDYDLHDLVRQGLNPVRIFVHLNSHQGAQSSVAPSNESASQGPSPQHVQPNITLNGAETLKSMQEPPSPVLMNLRSSNPNLERDPSSDVFKIVKSVQEPLAKAISKLSLDMSSKAASTSPILTELFDGLSKIGRACVNAALSNSGDTSMSTNVEGDDDSETNSDGMKQKCSIDEGKKNYYIHTGTPAQPSPKSSQANGVYVGHLQCPFLSTNKGKNASFASSSSKMSTNAEFLGSTTQGASGNKLNKTAADQSRGFQSYRGPIPIDEYSFAGTPLTRGHIFQPIDLSNRDSYKADRVGPVIHKGITCDGCGVHPITGPRFTSKVKFNFDLCGNCFSRMGNDAVYTRIDVPRASRHSWFFEAPDARRSCPYMKKPYAPEHPLSRFDSCFVIDVNVMDGTRMAPATPFVKIWRMRNNGKVPWNHGLKLLWVGGDRFSPSDSAEIRVPLTGVDVASELDIAVNFIAPLIPGRYISYWRMAEPSGRMFGQRVWVQIQVDSCLDLTRESFPLLNLNLPPENNETVFPHVSNVKSEPGLSVEVGESSAPPAPKQNNSNYPINFELLVANNLPYPSYAPASSALAQAFSTNEPVSPEALSSVSSPNIDDNTYYVPQVSSLLASYPTVDVGNNLDDNSCGQQLSEKTEFEKPGLEEKMLKELEQMGFKQTKLNKLKEVLRMNDYDLERSVDDLCDVSKWDPILEELQVMGFKDKELNKKLLVKNNGSISRVVIDLIAD